METEMIAVFIPIIFLLGFIYLAYTYINHQARERMTLLEKAQNSEDLKLLFKKKEASEPSANRNAKWGIILISLGLAIVTGTLLEPYYHEGIIFACIFLFPGIGLMIYYYLFRDKQQN